MESVTWFLSGGLVALIGVVAGLPVSVRFAWVGGALAALLVTALTKRLPAYAGAAVAVGVAGAATAPDVRYAALSALAGAVGPAVGAYGLLWAWAFLRSRVEARGQKVVANSAGADGRSARVDEAQLSAAQLSRLVRLATTDTASFRAQAGVLTVPQRQQLREALKADNDRGR